MFRMAEGDRQDKAELSCFGRYWVIRAWHLGEKDQCVLPTITLEQKHGQQQH